VCNSTNADTEEVEDQDSEDDEEKDEGPKTIFISGTEILELESRAKMTLQFQKATFKVI
jgi:hypothetical protein